mmetsp:Transcript_29134/g.64133  ORF Transcript_29134/g.64133 Transcript_29134/m.64133 type:complete len:209 (-) Transcript_29134:86-712(-)
MPCLSTEKITRLCWNIGCATRTLHEYQHPTRSTLRSLRDHAPLGLQISRKIRHVSHGLLPVIKVCEDHCAHLHLHILCLALVPARFSALHQSGTDTVEQGHHRILAPTIQEAVRITEQLPLAVAQPVRGQREVRGAPRGATSSQVESLQSIRCTRSSGVLDFFSQRQARHRAQITVAVLRQAAHHCSALACCKGLGDACSARDSQRHK